MRDREFYINSIKMDLFRVVTATGDVQSTPAIESAQEFLNHALLDFNKFETTTNDAKIKASLEELQNQLPNLSDPILRYRWADRILTYRSLL